MDFCPSLTHFQRRDSIAVRVGNVTIGGKDYTGKPNEIVVQSMTNCSTLDTRACVDQIERIRQAGGRVVRLTAPGRREGENLRTIMEVMHQRGIFDVGIVADIHFTPQVAMIAAQYVDKVRINPGNYNNSSNEFEQLIDKCRQRGVAIRIGVNHGSLSPAIVDKYGDTPEGMVESAIEFLEICRTKKFDQVVISMKSSNVRVMVNAYRQLAARMMSEGMTYAIHLGVTEAGDAEQGRVKSAVGIGALLADGIGDTIRISLTEPPENEICPAAILAHYMSSREEEVPQIKNQSLYSPYAHSPLISNAVGRLGGGQYPLLYTELNAAEKNAIDRGEIVVLTANGNNPSAVWRATILNMRADGDLRPVILHRHYNELSLEDLQIKAGADFGIPFIDGMADGIYVENPLQGEIDKSNVESLCLAILQAARVRISKTEYIACPGCGRTLYDLQKTLAGIRSRTSHLKGLKIGVMGCIVNGPGEMADADYGYVGSGAGLITLYKGREVVRRNIPEQDAIDALLDLIKTNGDWKEE